MSSPYNPPTSDEGYLREFNDWHPDFAMLVAQENHIQLGEAHWEVIQLLRSTYEVTHISPNTRALVKLVKTQLGPQKGNSPYLMQLFSGKPAPIACKIAGLPKPKQCF